MAASPDPKVSIVICNYNYAGFLPDAVESALGQTYPSLEVIVVDDGSTDASARVIGEFGTRIVPILKENGGQASACNAGFSHSSGALVLFLDADDVLLPDIVEKAVQAFQAHPSTAKIQYRMDVIDRSGTRTSQILPPTEFPLSSGDLGREARAFPCDLQWMAMSGNIYPRRTLEELLPLPEREDEKVGADWYLSLGSLLYGPVESIDQVGVLYRVHEGNNYHVVELVPDQIRRTIIFMQRTHEFLYQHAERLGGSRMPRDKDQVLSVAFLGHRLISLRLDPERHPVSSDRRLRLCLRGIRAAKARFNVNPPMRVAFALWFACMTLAPRGAVPFLARLFLFPESRERFNRAMRAFGRADGSEAPTETRVAVREAAGP